MNEISSVAGSRASAKPGGGGSAPDARRAFAGPAEIVREWDGHRLGAPRELRHRGVELFEGRWPRDRRRGSRQHLDRRHQRDVERRHERGALDRVEPRHITARHEIRPLRAGTRNERSKASRGVAEVLPRFTKLTAEELDRGIEGGAGREVRKDRFERGERAANSGSRIVAVIHRVEDRAEHLLDRARRGSKIDDRLSTVFERPADAPEDVVRLLEVEHPGRHFEAVARRRGVVERGALGSEVRRLIRHAPEFYSGAPAAEDLRRSPRCR